ncbi:MAG: TetR/AcrR family transcriptional regulator [Candidatus Obscuribacterales bacterium]|nr:TetR/AcrR family transcriptional regulator [Candidatus Obscuribacterales bacterium]
MGRPRADDYGEKQQLILDQAAVLFADKGFAGTSMATIAQFCHTSKALIYHYYTSKEALLFDMLQSHVQLLLKTANEVLQKDTEPEIRLRALLRSFMEIYVSSHAKHVVLLNDLHWLPSDQQSLIRDTERGVIKIFRDLVAEIRPDLNEPTRTGLAMSLLGSINWTYIWFDKNGTLSPQHFADLAASLFFSGAKSITDFR